MILPTKGMIFRKKYGGDKEPIDTRTYSKRLRIYTIVVFSFVRTFAP